MNEEFVLLYSLVMHRQDIVLPKDLFDHNRDSPLLISIKYNYSIDDNNVCLTALFFSRLATY
jgi:hypothetical protein